MRTMFLNIFRLNGGRGDFIRKGVKKMGVGLFMKKILFYGGGWGWINLVYVRVCEWGGGGGFNLVCVCVWVGGGN